MHFFLKYDSCKCRRRLDVFMGFKRVNKEPLQRSDVAGNKATKGSCGNTPAHLRPANQCTRGEGRVWVIKCHNAVSDSSYFYFPLLGQTDLHLSGFLNYSYRNLQWCKMQQHGSESMQPPLMWWLHGTIRAHNLWLLVLIISLFVFLLHKGKKAIRKK